MERCDGRKQHEAGGSDRDDTNRQDQQRDQNVDRQQDEQSRDQDRNNPARVRQDDTGIGLGGSSTDNDAGDNIGDIA